jgi:hypothetical protein
MYGLFHPARDVVPPLVGLLYSSNALAFHGGLIMSLNRLFRLISVALLALFLAFAVALVWTEWSTYRSGANSVPALRKLRLALLAMEKVSAERGPPMPSWGGSALAPELQVRLADARARSDAALNQLRTALETDSKLRQSWALDKVRWSSRAGSGTRQCRSGGAPVGRIAATCWCWPPSPAWSI